MLSLITISAAPNVEGKYVGFKITDKKYESNIYEDLELFVHVNENENVNNVSLTLSNNKIFGEKVIMLDEKLVEISKNSNGKILKISLQPKSIGKSDVKLNINGKNIINEEAIISINKPAYLISNASEAGKIIIPNKININDNEIKKFVEFENTSNILNTLNSKYSKDISNISKKINTENTIITEKNYQLFLEYINELIINKDESIIKLQKSISIHSVLTVYNNSINNNIIDNMLSKLETKTKLLRNNDLIEKETQETLANIYHMLPNNNAIKKSIKDELIEPSMRAFGDGTANAYATKHATSANTSKYVYITGNNCANFVSQVIRAGGRGMTKTWKYDKALGASNNYSTYAWKNAHGLRSYFGTSFSSTNFKSFSYNVYPATAIFVDWNGDGLADHSGWVTKANTFYKSYKDQFGKTRTYMNFRVAQNTNAYHEWVSNNANNWERTTGRFYVTYFQ